MYRTFVSPNSNLIFALGWRRENNVQNICWYISLRKNKINYFFIHSSFIRKLISADEIFFLLFLHFNNEPHVTVSFRSIFTLFSLELCAFSKQLQLTRNNCIIFIYKFLKSYLKQLLQKVGLSLQLQGSDNLRGITRVVTTSSYETSSYITQPYKT